jgi:predicted nucleic acid-binding protein
MPLADTLLRLAELPPVYEARWTDEILGEVTRTLLGKFGRSPAKVAYRELRMRASFPDAIVQGYEPLISTMENHPKDRHVLAAAVRCEADYLVTLNLKDFPAKAVEKYAVQVVGPSAFLRQLWAINGIGVRERLREQTAGIGTPITRLLDRLAESVPAFVSEIRSEFD